jgi:hypothetical protein
MSDNVKPKGYFYKPPKAYYKPQKGISLKRKVTVRRKVCQNGPEEIKDKFIMTIVEDDKEQVVMDPRLEC